MGFDGGWGLGVNFLQLLFVGFSILFWIALLAVLVLLVRFLLIGTKAAQVYLRRHEPRPPAPDAAQQP
ncbi:MAG: hypothetical protein JWP66_1315, partial [Naasia sp.]|nr:hypothetical protein [Naasia sp.]